MILQWLCDLLYNVWNAIFGWINIPSFEDGTVESVNDYVSYIIEMGASIMNFFIPIQTFSVLIGIVVAIIAFKYLYFLIMWIVKKIPMAGMS